MALAVRNEGGVDFSGSDGDYVPIAADAKGHLMVRLGDETLTVVNAAGTANIGDVDVLTVPADPFGVNGDAASATGSISANLRFIAGTGIPVTSLPALAAGTNNIGDVDVLTLPGVAGSVAHESPDSGNPVKMGGYATSSERAVVATGDRVDFVADLTGKQVVLPFANPENFVSGTQSSSMTGTSDTAVIAARSGVRLYITTVVVTNGHSTVGTYVNLKDGSTTMASGYAAAAGGRISVHFNPPLRLTANTAFNAANVTTGSDVRVYATGYRGV